MFVVLVPIFVSVLGYVTYELVKMGMNEFKEWAEGGSEGGGCPEGAVFYTLGADGKLHCFMGEEGEYCPPPSTFDGVNAAGEVDCECPPPNVLIAGDCLPPDKSVYYGQEHWNSEAARCPQGTTLQTTHADGSITCICEEPNTWDGENCNPPVLISTTVSPIPRVQPTITTPTTPPPTPPTTPPPAPPAFTFDDCKAAFEAIGYSPQEAYIECLRTFNRRNVNQGPPQQKKYGDYFQKPGQPGGLNLDLSYQTRLAALNQHNQTRGDF